MKRILFKKILILYFIITPLLIISLQFYLSSVIKNNYLSNLRENLIIHARLIAEKIPSSYTSNLDDFCRGYKEKTGARVTIINDSGRVLGDSDESSYVMENHLNRPEIQDAMISDVGSSVRLSRTLSENFFYLAIAINRPEKIFLRLSMPLNEIETEINKIRMKVVIASLASLLAVIFIGLFQTKRITKSIEEITSFSKEVAAGNFKKRLFLSGKDELGELGRNISDMAQQLNIRLKQSEEEKQKVEAILKNMSDGLILTDTKGKIILSNSAFKNLFGLETQIEGKTLMEILRKAELIDVIEDVVENKKRISLEFGINYPGELYLMTTASPFTIKGEVSGAVLTFHDITRLKRLEEIRKDFVANVSHEIKTPITAIKGFAETLLEGAIEDKENAKKFLETIKNHSERLNSLVTDLLTLSKIELGDIKIEKTDVNLDEIIEAVFTTLKEEAYSRGLYLKKQIDSEIREIKADRNRLIQILINLVDNGIKFTEEGGVTVKVRSEKLKVKNGEERNFVTISIEDTGMGIPKKHIPRLGERFYRVDSARSRELGGTGLGLAIVKHLVKAHGWEMEIESEEGKGTTVRILCNPII
ncbi:MAG: PAS domain S-box protein [Nitrospirae bacterium]|nr:PAS domain S-box protein [Nitrospirota bacterium]